MKQRHEHRVWFGHGSLFSRWGHRWPLVVIRNGLDGKVLMSLGVLLPIAALMGLLIGSFLTVVAERVPQGGSVVAPPSRCGNCGLRLGPLDLFPVVSWLVLRGKCRQCKAEIGIEPLVLELATATLFVIFALKFRDDAVLPAFCILAATLVVQSWIDLNTQTLPRPITLWGTGLGAIALAVAALVNGEPERIWMAALGAFIALALIGGIYWGSSLYYGSPQGMGWGDVVLSPLLGMYLGYLNPGIVAPGMFFGFILGAVAGIGAMIAGKAGKQTALPFGPFLALGTVIAVFIGQHFVDLVLAR
jgi:leader peptidase (prepilin peptidase)/N-methyltransferase